MKLFREALIILILYIIGEVITAVTHVPIPGNIIAMILLFIALCLKIIKLEQINTISNFFLDHLAFFFLPAGVAVMNSFGLIKANIVQILIVCLVTTAITMTITGLVVQAIANKMDKKKQNNLKEIK
ncbi:CidA/LrgA family protein [Clostridium thermobutyricum]|uniref:Antiholin-like protein LrgA n=1 Tax=Clostridium thermobutyricum DSM 4928 TaxID=1121339 RepID=A0A1V4T0C5_9CLOT|nr:CidA/LrgA family protein [Clostridium thermobutyricum]OPX50099.1 antiholin-like protein LrgA [Clostridium thermobutyricum DSM 4928]